MRVLVTAASKYGSTMEIAQAVGKVVSDNGIDIELWASAVADELQVVSQVPGVVV